MSEGMYFGTKEYMTWVAPPQIEMTDSSVGWGTSGAYINGGAFVRSSATKHKVYGMTWSMKPLSVLSQISDFADGLYGQGPFYFLVPGSYDNVLPQSWATPRLAAEDAPLLVDGPRPTLIDAPPALRYPTKSAVYTIDNADAARQRLSIPVPPGYYLHLGVHGSFTGTAQMVYSVNNGAATVLTPIGRTATQANARVAGPAWVDLWLRGEGTATLNAMVAEVSKSAAPRTGDFISGKGHSGAKFDENGFETTLYSAAKDKHHGTAKFIEVAQWA